jgi:hypothetical protein
MATDFSYATKLGLDVRAITAARTASNPTEETISRALGISLSEANPILDEVANVPATMVAPVATAGAAGTASIAFTAPAANGSPITAYEITSSRDAKVFTSTDDLVTPIVVTGLSAGAQTFTIKAINDIGKSVASPASNSITVT